MDTYENDNSLRPEENAAAQEEYAEPVPQEPIAQPMPAQEEPAPQEAPEQPQTYHAVGTGRKESPFAN